MAGSGLGFILLWELGREHRPKATGSGDHVVGLKFDSIGVATKVSQREITLWRYSRLHFYSLSGLKQLPGFKDVRSSVLGAESYRHFSSGVLA
jgi:hypothetical protein